MPFFQKERGHSLNEVVEMRQNKLARNLVPARGASTHAVPS